MHRKRQKFSTLSKKYMRKTVHASIIHSLIKNNPYFLNKPTGEVDVDPRAVPQCCSFFNSLTTQATSTRELLQLLKLTVSSTHDDPSTRQN